MRDTLRNRSEFRLAVRLTGIVSILIAIGSAGLIVGCGSRPPQPDERSAPADRSAPEPDTADEADTADEEASVVEAEMERPQPPDEPASDQADAPSTMSLQDSIDQTPAPLDGEAALSELGYVSPSDQVQQLLAPPPGTVRLSQTSPLWIDPQNKRVFVDGYVAQQEAYLEMFACPAETKEHESVVAVIAKSSELHAALLAVGAEPGRPVLFEPEYKPAVGQSIRIWVMWRDEKDQFQTTDARDWVRRAGTDEALDRDWVFAGSLIWKDPVDGNEYYQADSGEMICVSNFGTALLDLPIESSDVNSALQFEAYSGRIPPRGTPLRLMLMPVVDQDADPPVLTESMMPLESSEK